MFGIFFLNRILLRHDVPPLWYLYYNSQGVRQAIIIVIVMTLSPRNYDKAFRQYFLLTPKM